MAVFLIIMKIGNNKYLTIENTVWIAETMKCSVINF